MDRRESRAEGGARSAPDSTRVPSAGAAGDHGAARSKTPSGQQGRDHGERPRRRRAAPSRTLAGPRGRPAGPPSDDGPPGPRATARSSLDTRSRRSASRHYAAARARRSTALAPADAPSPGYCDPVRVRGPAPRARQTSGTASSAAASTPPGVKEASHRSPETIAHPRRATRPPIARPPRSSVPPQSLPRTAVGLRAGPLVDRVIVMYRVRLDLIVAAVSWPSHTDPRPCCDDRLNPGWLPRSE